MTSLIISLAVSALLLIGFSIAEPRVVHWFAVPLLGCGVLIGSDAVDWVRGKLSVLDPIGMLGFLGYQFFFLAPLLHVVWDSWMLYVIPPPDWRPWLGVMALLNFIGLLLYRRFRGSEDPSQFDRRRTMWRLDVPKFLRLLVIALAGTAVLQLWVYQQFGGLQGYVEAYLESERNYGSTDPSVPFVNMGWLLTISESFPILAAIGYAVLSGRYRRMRTWPALLLMLAGILVLQMLFGGLRGSRSNTVWGLFWAAGIIHFRIRRIPRTLVYAGIAFLALFMYVYGFYKHAGLDALTAFNGSEARAELERRTGRTWATAILSDFARSDVQAYAAYKLIPNNSDYEYALGRTYVGALALLVPRTLWPERPESKIRWTTELETGKGSFSPGVWQSSRVYGIAGEAMLNFGPAVVPLTFVILAAAVRRIRRFIFTLAPGDSRLLFAPLFVMFSFLVLINDSDVNVFFLIKYGAVPIGLIAAASAVRPLTAPLRRSQLAEPRTGVRAVRLLHDVRGAR